MFITVTSDIEFNELVYDKACGLAKKMITKNKSKAVAFTNKYTITASKINNSVIVKIRQNRND